jgi:hypothetical protein
MKINIKRICISIATIGVIIGLHTNIIKIPIKVKHHPTYAANH